MPQPRRREHISSGMSKTIGSDLSAGNQLAEVANIAIVPEKHRKNEEELGKVVWLVRSRLLFQPIATVH